MYYVSTARTWGGSGKKESYDVRSLYIVVQIFIHDLGLRSVLDEKTIDLGREREE